MEVNGSGTLQYRLALTHTLAMLSPTTLMERRFHVSSSLSSRRGGRGGARSDPPSNFAMLSGGVLSDFEKSAVASSDGEPCAHHCSSIRRQHGAWRVYRRGRGRLRACPWCVVVCFRAEERRSQHFRLPFLLSPRPPGPRSPPSSPAHGTRTVVLSSDSVPGGSTVARSSRLTSPSLSPPSPSLSTSSRPGRRGGPRCRAGRR